MENDEPKKPKSSTIRDKAIKAGKIGVKVGIAAGKVVKESIEEVIEEAKETNKADQQSSKQTQKKEVKHKLSQTRKKPMSSPSYDLRSGVSGLERSIEDHLFSWVGWFYSIFAYMIVIIISFVIAASDTRFWPLPIVMLIGFPFYIFWAIINTIPEIKIGNRVLFSKSDLSLQRQFSFGRAVARTFSREMIRNSPEGAAFIGLFFLILLFVILSPFLL